MNDLFQVFSARRRRAMAFVVSIGVIGALGRSLLKTYASLHPPLYADDVYQDVMTPIMNLAHPGERVFHSDWDEFPILFRLDDRLKYVAGLDPTFLYEASSTLSDAYREVTWGRVPPTPDQVWELVHGRLQARFLFIAKTDHRALFEVVRADGRYRLLAESSEAATFVVK